LLMNTTTVHTEKTRMSGKHNRRLSGKVAYAIFSGVCGTLLLVMFCAAFLDVYQVVKYLPWMIAFNTAMTGFSLIEKTRNTIARNHLLAVCAGLANGQCGLVDDSNAGDWRLPDIRELQSLVDYDSFQPALPLRHPFTGAKHNYYWSSTSYVGKPGYAWFVHMGHGYVGVVYKDHDYYLWPVRDDDRSID